MHICGLLNYEGEGKVLYMSKSIVHLKYSYSLNSQFTYLYVVNYLGPCHPGNKSYPLDPPPPLEISFDPRSIAVIRHMYAPIVKYSRNEKMPLPPPYLLIHNSIRYVFFNIYTEKYLYYQVLVLLWNPFYL